MAQVGHTLDLLQQSLHDIDLMSEKLGNNNVSKRIVAKVKNTMSDKSSVQKSFNRLLEDYRANILPEVLSDWQDLETDEKVARKMNNFFVACISLSVLLSNRPRHWHSGKTSLFRQGGCCSTTFCMGG